MQYIPLKSTKDWFTLIWCLLAAVTLTYVIFYPIFEGNQILNDIMGGFCMIFVFGAWIFFTKKKKGERGLK
jgi:amino acid permease